LGAKAGNTKKKGLESFELGRKIVKKGSNVVFESLRTRRKGKGGWVDKGNQGKTGPPVL